LNEKVTAAVDRLLGINSAAWITMGSIAGGLIYAGVAIGDFSHRLERVEERASLAQHCASTEQCNAVKSAVADLERKVVRLEYKTGVAQP
jgi:hypothetical protein